jgi:high-affinity Fe2+/Pb2+ permease
MKKLDPQEKANIKMIVLAFVLVATLIFMIVWMFISARKNHQELEKDRQKIKELIYKDKLKTLLETADSLETLIQLDTLDCGIIYRATSGEIETQLTLQEVEKIRELNGFNN